MKSVPSGTGSSGLDCPAEIKYALYGSNRREGCDQYPPGRSQYSGRGEGGVSSPTCFFVLGGVSYARESSRGRFSMACSKACSIAWAATSSPGRLAITLLKY